VRILKGLPNLRLQVRILKDLFAPKLCKFSGLGTAHSKGLVDLQQTGTGVPCPYKEKSGICLPLGRKNLQNGL
jgi:hypothetical protein